MMHPVRIACVVSEFNAPITDALYQGAHQRLLERGVASNSISVYKVPGAIEIPLVAQRLARTECYSAIICLGAVIRGETSHYDYVCQQVSAGCQHIMLTFDLPILFGILTVENEEQALERVGGKHGHKGIECADAALSMIRVLHHIEEQHSAFLKRPSQHE